MSVSTTTKGHSAVEEFQRQLSEYLARPQSLSARELAKRVGVSHVHIGRLRDGESVPGMDLAINICHEIGLDLAKIFKKTSAST